MKTTCSTLALALLIFASSHAQAEEDSKHHLGLQAGWYSFEMDYESPAGVFADFGIPYMIWAAYGREVIPLHIRGGFGFHGGKNWQVRLGLRLNMVTSMDGPLVDWSSDYTDGAAFWWMLMPELEFRYDFDTGLCLGLVLPITAFGYSHHTEETRKVFWPFAPILSQIYFGYRLGL